MKTIILDDKAHVGGITYDYDRDILWWSNDDVHATGGLSSIPLATLEKYDAKKVKRPIVSNYHAIDWLRRTSSIVYHEDQIVVTVYGRKKDQRGLYSIPVDPKTGIVRTFQDLSDKQLQGIIDYTTNQNFIDTLIKDNLIQSIAPAWDRVQGLSIANTGLSLFSQSNGYSPSILWLEMPNDKSGTDFKFSPPKNVVDHLYFPPSVEQTSLQKPNDDKMALVFESGAKKYRNRRSFINRPMIMDRLLVISMSIDSIK